MLIKPFTKLDKRGDTIVEVLIAIAVVSAVLGGAFASAQRSLNGTQMSRERGEALKYVQQQLERLGPALAASSPSGSTAPFCVQDNLSLTGTCNEGPDGRYEIFITPNTGTPGQYTASARWDRSGGGEEQQLDIVYRVH